MRFIRKKHQSEGCCRRWLRRQSEGSAAALAAFAALAVSTAAFAVAVVTAVTVRVAALTPTIRTAAPTVRRDLSFIETMGSFLQADDRPCFVASSLVLKGCT
jgi:hypothetical protein